MWVMAKKNLNGQMSMFDYFRNLEKEVPANGEVEMVSFMPEDFHEDTEEKETYNNLEDNMEIEGRNDIKAKNVIEAKNDVEDKNIDDIENAVMQKEIINKNSGEKFVISYINYNTVVVKNEMSLVKVYKFETTKEAVDCYVEQISILRKSE